MKTDAGLVLVRTTLVFAMAFVRTQQPDKP